jgi:K+-sensing histidine kinase KdpD
MTVRRDDRDPDAPLVRFLERIKRSFSHDLRTPLATIVNYATVLEASEGSESGDVKDLSRRIRNNAQRLSNMLQLLAQATSLASRPWRSTSADLLSLARSVLHDAGGSTSVRWDGPASGAVVAVDAEIVGFVWRTFIVVQGDAQSRPVVGTELRLHPSSERMEVELICAEHGPAADASPAALELPAFLRHNNGPARLESGMGLSLAEDLVISHGAELRVWGRPGSTSGVRLSFEVAA